MLPFDAVDTVDEDVLCGSGHQIAKHPGNLRLRRVTAAKFIEYTKALGKGQKAKITSAIMYEVLLNGGRVLKKDPVYAKWYKPDNPDKVLRDKITHLLRLLIKKQQAAQDDKETKETKKKDQVASFGPDNELLEEICRKDTHQNVVASSRMHESLVFDSQPSHLPLVPGKKKLQHQGSSSLLLLQQPAPCFLPTTFAPAQVPQYHSPIGGCDFGKQEVENFLVTTDVPAICSAPSCWLVQEDDQPTAAPFMLPSFKNKPSSMPVCSNATTSIATSAKTRFGCMLPTTSDFAPTYEKKEEKGTMIEQEDDEETDVLDLIKEILCFMA